MLWARQSFLAWEEGSVTPAVDRKRAIYRPAG